MNNMFSTTNKTAYLILLSALTLQACSSSSPPSSSRYSVRHDYGPTKKIDVSHVKNAVPKPEPKSKYGNPETYEVLGKQYNVRDSSEGYTQTGIASWYGKKFHGHRTSNGEIYDMYAMTAAHKSLPLPTYVRVTHLKNDRSVIVKVNDRGPFHAGRIIDLSYSAAKKLGITATGTGQVKVTAIDPVQFQQAKALKAKPKRPSALQTKDEVLAKSKLYLQVGAFSDKKNATRLKKRMVRMFKATQVHSDFEADKNIYRIRIGPLLSAAVADKLTLLLNNKGIQSKAITLE